MTKSFDIDKYNSRECQVHNHGFYLGAQSKQSEVDGLQLKLSEDSRVLHNVIDIERKKCEKLQKRIDEAMKYVAESPLKDVSRRAMINFMDILKGDSHES